MILVFVNSLLEGESTRLDFYKWDMVYKGCDLIHYWSTRNAQKIYATQALTNF